MNDSTNTETEHPPTNGKRNKALVLFTLVLLAVGLGWFLLWFFYFQYEEYTDDAYSNGNMITINSVVQGSVVAFYADNTDLVEQGQLLIALDPTEFQINYERSLESLAATVLQVRQLYDSVDVNRASVESSRVQFNKADYDFQNRSQLVGSKAVSNEDYIHSRDAQSIAELNLKQAEATLKVSISAAGNTPIRQHPRILEAAGTVRRCYYELKHCSIYAPVTGYIAQRAVEVGARVSSNSSLMWIIPTENVWVDANFKETQLEHMRVGQPTTVTFDMYGSDVKYKGHVVGIGMGSGSVFSLIPPQNATGNWIKIVQRLPVRISLDPEVVKKFPVRLGISASVYVDITDRSLPMLAEAPSKRAVATTPIFDIDMSEVEKRIRMTVRENLSK